MRNNKTSKINENIKKIEEMLEKKSRSLKELEKELKITPQEMSELIQRLDKGKYIVTKHPRDERQKVLMKRLPEE